MTGGTQEPTAISAGDLTPDHYGLLVTWERAAKGSFGPVHMSVVLDELRRWINKDGRQVGITDFTPTGGFVGTEHHIPADTVVTVGRRIRKPRQRRWSKIPLQTWEEAEADG